MELEDDNKENSAQPLPGQTPVSLEPTVLSGSGKAVDLLDGTSRGSQAAERAAAFDAIAQELIKGKTVIKQRFVLEKLMGFGGMGTVYQARDLRKVEVQDRDPWVAIKLLNEDFKKHPAAFISLQREARKSQALAHANIVQVFDFDRDGDSVFMTMELLHGHDLSKHIRDHPAGLSVEEGLAITRDMAAALQHAHDNNIIHTDFTPKNVFLTESGKAKVLDFGIAQAIAFTDSGESGNENTVFDPASLGGVTPGYASLEMLTGMAPVPADDVYALGCLMYQLFSGEHPYNNVRADNAHARGMRPRRIEKLSRRQWRALQKALALPREERYQGVAEFMSDFAPVANPAVRPRAVAAGVVLVVLGAAAYQTLSNWEAERVRAQELQRQQAQLADSRAQLDRQHALSEQKAMQQADGLNQEYLALAESLLVKNQFEETQQYLEKVRLAVPEHPRLAYLETRLREARLSQQQLIQQQEALGVSVAELLSAAEAAFEAKRFVRPGTNSAFTLYQQVLALDPDNPQAQTLRRRIIQTQLASIAQTLRTGRLEEAAIEISDLALVAPRHPELPPYERELERLQLQQRSRQDLIESLLVQAAAVVGSDQDSQRRYLYVRVLEIDPGNLVARQELDAAETRIEKEKLRLASLVRGEAEALLQQAQQLLVTEPATPEHFSRSYQYLREAQRKSPDLEAVHAQLAQLPLHYFKIIEARIAAEDYAQAEEFLQAASVLVPGNPELADLRAQLAARISAAEELLIPSSF